MLMLQMNGRRKGNNKCKQKSRSLVAKMFALKFPFAFLFFFWGAWGSLGFGWAAFSRFQDQIWLDVVLDMSVPSNGCTKQGRVCTKQGYHDLETHVRGTGGPPSTCWLCAQSMAQDHCNAVLLRSAHHSLCLCPSG